VIQGPLRGPLSRKQATRDIVQFVPFNAMNGDGNRLASELLAEVPAQVVSYFKLKKIAPHPPPPPPPIMYPPQQPQAPPQALYPPEHP
jgi:hypothetical protein